MSLQEKQVLPDALAAHHSWQMSSIHRSTMHQSNIDGSLLATSERPDARWLYTFKDLLDMVGASRSWIAQKLAITTLDLQAREQNPSLLTLAEVLTLAPLIRLPTMEIISTLIIETASVTGRISVLPIKP